MALDMKAIADALAARYAPGVVTPPTGLPNIVAATATPPNAIPQSPYVVVWPDTGRFTHPPARRKAEHDFLVHFHYARHEGDIPRESAALLRWLGVLFDQTNGQLQLGLAPIVTQALVQTWDIGSLVYAGVEYDGIVLGVRVWTSDTVNLVA